MYAHPSLQETKVGPLFGSFTFKKGLCVGMKIGGHTKWLLLTEIKNTNLMGIFSREGPEGFTLGRSKWKSLIEGSSMHVSSSAG